MAAVWHWTRPDHGPGSSPFCTSNMYALPLTAGLLSTSFFLQAIWSPIPLCLNSSLLHPPSPMWWNNLPVPFRKVTHTHPGLVVAYAEMKPSVQIRASSLTIRLQPFSHHALQQDRLVSFIRVSIGSVLMESYGSWRVVENVVIARPFGEEKKERKEGYTKM